MNFALERPAFLWTLVLALPIVWVAVRSRRTFSRGRQIVSTGARILLLAILALALSGLTRNEPADALGVVFVVDRSASVDAAARERAEEFVAAALAHQGKRDVAGVVAFGADAMLEAEPSEKLVFHGIETVPSPHQTDIAAGLRLATAILPSDRTRRIVVLSDGAETHGDAVTQVVLSAGEDLEISVVALGSERGPEVLVEDLQMPARVDEGAAYAVRVVARSEEPAAGTLRLYRNDTYLGDMRVALTGGRSQVFTIRQEAEAPGLYRYRVALEVDDPSLDALPQNNEVMSTIEVTGRPKILYVEGYPNQAAHLSKALVAEGLVVEVIEPAALPPGLSELRPYAAVVLSDAPAYAMSRRQMEALRSYVRDLGRGLIMVGGDKSFGLGGYYQTPVEEALPVQMDIEDKTRFPKLGMVIAMDKSCSMGGGAGSKLGMAKEAGIETAQLLNDRDLLGVIGFDDAASWIVPLGDLSDKARVTNTIGSVRTGGGTDIYPAVERAVAALDASDASLKHIILLSDGITSAGSFQALITKANKDSKITLTAVAIGSDADRHTMQNFANWGGGNYYLVTDITSIPSIFTRETLLATRAFLVEDPMKPRLSDPSDVLRGLRSGDFPTFYGYVATQAKDRAIVPLRTTDDYNAPLLAHWYYGLGRSLAFTSDAKAKWSRDWVGTPEFTRFWTQAARWAVGDPDAATLQATAEIDKGELLITVDAFDDGGSFRNFLKGEARIVSPDLTVRTVTLRQVAPGRYQGATPVDQDGSWLAGVAMRQGETVIGQAVAEAIQPYSPEYRSTGTGTGVIAEIGRLGRGGQITDPAAVFTRPTVARNVPHPWWPWLLAVAALLLVADVALRRLDFERQPKTIVGPAPSMLAARAKPKKRKRAVVKAPSTTQEATVVEEAKAVEVAPQPELDPESYAGRLLAARGSARHRRRQKEDD